MDKDRLEKFIKEFIINNPNMGRKNSFSRFVRELHGRKLLERPLTILESGVSRKSLGENVACDGNSTSLWGKIAQLTGGHVYTCDIEAYNMEQCKRWTAEWKDYITYVVDDSLNFFANFDKPIDILYPDSFDTHPWDRNIIDMSCSHQLGEITRVYNNLKEDSLILLDDIRENPFIGGKSEKSLPFLLERGWKIHYHEKQDGQILMSK